MDFAAALPLIAKIVAGLSGLAGTLFAAWKFYKSRKGEENKWFLYMKNISNIYSRLHDIRAAYEADRVTMFLLTDSGNIPAPGVPLFLYSMYEAKLDNTVRSMRDSFNRRPLREAQADQLSKLAVNKEVSLLVDEVNVDDQEIWQAYQINRRILIELKSTEGSYLFLAIDNPVENIEPASKEDVNVALLEVKDLLNNKPKKILEVIKSQL